MKRYQKIATKIISALLMSGFLLLAACNQELDFQPPKDEHTKENATQGAKPTPQEPDGKAGPSPVTPSGPSATPENKTPSTDGTSSNTPGTTTPSAGGDADSTVTGDSTAEQKVAPWSDPSEYEYYYNPTYSPITGEYVEVKKELRDRIVPQAVKALLKTFPKTFDYMKDWAVGFGLNVTYMDYNREMAASFKLDLNVDTDLNNASHTTYSMMINMACSDIDLKDGMQLNETQRTYLESLCVHELMHAMMYEALTCGMSGVNAQGSDITPFPDWFREGTAEAACGGGSRGRTMIPLGLTTEEIILKLKAESLTDEDTRSSYTVGWFAVMYLAYLTNLTTDNVSILDVINDIYINPVSLAEGLDTFLSEIHYGESLSGTIQKYSQGKYSDLNAFQTEFVQDPYAASFIKKLLEAVGDGQGSLITGNFSDKDVLSSTSNDELMLFWICTRYDKYSNTYGDALDISELLVGGSATERGVSGERKRNPSPEILK